MRVSDIQQSLASVVKDLKAVIQQNLIHHDNHFVGWRNYKTGIIKNTYYPLEYQWHVDNQQYSLILKDQSFFQFYYQFEKEELKKARLAYYPKPIVLNHEILEYYEAAERAESMEDQDMYEHMLGVIEQAELSDVYPTNTSHIRFDYDAKADSHSKSHIQYSSLESIRIPANFYPMPYAFVKLICRSFPESFLKYTECEQSRAHSINNQMKCVDVDDMMAFCHKSQSRTVIDRTPSKPKGR